MNALIRYDASTMAVTDWAAKISARWHDSIEAIFDTGRLIAEAKAALPHGEFTQMIREALPFGARTAQRLMQVAADTRLTNPTHVSLLPPNWGTLYEITRLDDAAFEARIADGTIRPDMDRKDISTAVKQQVRATRERLLGGAQMSVPEVQVGVYVEDFEWDHITWSDKGRDRAAENHYIVARDAHTAQEIVDRTADRFKNCAQDAVLFEWATVQHLHIAIDVMRLRGFEYKSSYVWGKDSISLGYWNRNKHEILLIGVKGNPPCPAPGTQWDSLIIAPKGIHSAKPEIFLQIVETYFPTMPKLELNARRRRKGWLQAGNQLEDEITEAPEPDGSSKSVSHPEPVPVDALKVTAPETGTGSLSSDDQLDIPDFLRRSSDQCVFKDGAAQ